MEKHCDTQNLQSQVIVKSLEELCEWQCSKTEPPVTDILEMYLRATTLIK